MLKINEYLQIPLRELEFTYVRSSGPGGQNVNKTATKAEMRWDINATSAIYGIVRDRFLEQNKGKISGEGYFVLKSDKFRDQARNTSDCLEKLKKLLETAFKIPKKRKPTKPTRASVERRIGSKKKNSDKKSSRKYTPSRDG